MTNIMAHLCECGHTRYEHSLPEYGSTRCGHVTYGAGHFIKVCFCSAFQKVQETETPK